MIYRKPFVASLSLILIHWSLGAAQTGHLNGYVTDSISGEPLPSSNVVIEGTKKGGAADSRGYFVLQNIPAGKYIVQVSRIGYESDSRKVQIISGEALFYNFRLRAKAVKFSEVLVTATRENKLKSEVAVATEIINRSEIEKSNSQNIGEVLEDAAGLFVKNYGNIGSLKTVSMRGASENQVLILLDGQRLNLAQGIAPDLGDIPLHAIERIEIVRGGHSSLYGTDAVGGVINLITRSSAGKGIVSGQLTSTVGSFGTRTVEGDFAQNLGGFNYFVTHKYTESAGDFEFRDSEGQTARRTNNRLQFNDTFLKLSYSLKPSILLSGFVQFHDADRGVPGPLNFLSETAVQRDRSWKYNFRYEQQFSANLNLKTQAFLYNFEQNFDDPEAFFPISSEHKNDIYGISVQSNWRWSNANKITGGYEFRKDKINSTDVSSQKRTNHGVFIQNQIDLPLQSLQTDTRLSLIPALRLDKHSDMDAQLSPKMGFLINYASKFNLTLRSNLGRSYRVPSFNDLYWPAGSFTAGNPNLLPEKGLGYDLGLSMNFRRTGFWGLEINYFNTSLDDLIIWGPREDGVWSPQNIHEASIQGIESRLSFQSLNDFINLQANYDYLNAVNNTDDELLNGKDLIYRPKHKFAFNLNLNFRQFEFFATHRYIGRRFANADNSTSLHAYNITDIGVSHDQSLGAGVLKIIFEARNMFDEQTQIIENYPVPGREYRTSLGFEF